MKAGRGLSKVAYVLKADSKNWTRAGDAEGSAGAFEVAQVDGASESKRLGSMEQKMLAV